MSGEFVIPLVLSCRSKNLKQQTGHCYSSVLLASKLHPQGLRADQPKDTQRRSPQLKIGSSFYLFFLLPLILPYVNWASQEGCLFYLRSSLRFSDLPLFYFCMIFPSLSFSHCHSGFLFPILPNKSILK